MYKNNGKIYTSGIKPDLHDFDSIVLPKKEKEPRRDRNDIGIKKNKFIEYKQHIRKKIQCVIRLSPS